MIFRIIENHQDLMKFREAVTELFSFSEHDFYCAKCGKGYIPGGIYLFFLVIDTLTCYCTDCQREEDETWKWTLLFAYEYRI